MPHQNFQRVDLRSVVVRFKEIQYRSGRFYFLFRSSYLQKGEDTCRPTCAFLCDSLVKIWICDPEIPGSSLISFSLLWSGNGLHTSEASFISVYLSSLPVAYMSDAPKRRSRRLTVTGESARTQDETTESSAWFFNKLVV